MALTPPGSLMQADYLCLMPSANSTDSQTARMDLDELVELDPVQSWAALSHLDGKCLYSKQGWFTYS
jgi:protein OS-9